MSKEQGNERLIVAEPVVKPLRADTTLVGVDHLVKFDDLNLPPQPFLTLLEQADEVYMESPHRKHSYPNYEDFAYKRLVAEGREHNLHFLEATFDPMQLADGYNIPREVMLLGMDTRMVFFWLDKRRTEGADAYPLNELVQLITEDFQEKYSSIAALSKDEINDLLRPGIDALIKFRERYKGSRKEEPKKAQFIHGFRLFVEYMVDVRDYEFICPEVSKAMDSTPGQKLIIVGENHISTIERLVSGEAPEQSRPWPDHIKSLSWTDRKAAGLFDSVYQGHVSK